MQRGAVLYNKLGMQLARYKEVDCLQPITLDVIYDRHRNVIYILDLIWTNQCDGPLSDFDFRRFTLRSFIDSGNLRKAPVPGGCSFVLQPAIDCDRDAMAAFMAEPQALNRRGLVCSVLISF